MFLIVIAVIIIKNNVIDFFWGTSKTMYRIIDFVLERYKLIFVVTLFLTIPFIYGYLNQDFSNSIESFFENDDPDIAAYQKFQSQFGNDEFAVIALHDEMILTVENLNLIKRITELAQSYKGIQQVKSLTNLELVIGYGDTVDFKHVFPSGVISDEMITVARGILAKHKPFKHSILSNDYKTAAVFLEIESTIKTKEKIRILNQIRQKTEHLASAVGVKLYYCGIPYVESDSFRLIEDDIKLFTPVFLIVILGLMFLTTGNFALVVLILACAVVPSVTGIGLLITSGETVNSITLHTGIILLILSLINSSHIVSNYRKEYLQNGYNHRLAVEKSSKAQWLPCFITTLATSIIFFAYSLTSLRSLKITGVFSGVGILYIFFVTMVFLPAVLMVFRKWIDTRPRKPELIINNIFKRILDKICRFSLQSSGLIIFLFIGSSALLALGIPKLNYDTSFSRYISADSQVLLDTGIVEGNLTGTVRTELIVRALSTDFFFNKPDSLFFLKDIQSQVVSLMDGQYSSAYSVADYMSEMHMAFNGGKKTYYRVPEIDVELNDYYELGDESILKQIVSPDKREARISFYSKMTQPDQTDRLLSFLETSIAGSQQKNYAFTITGRYSLAYRLKNNLKQSLIIFSCIITSLMLVGLLLLTRKVLFSILCGLLFIFPCLCVFGVLGYTGVPVYPSTIMVAGISLGVTVDSMIRFFFEFNRYASDGETFETTVMSAFQGRGKIIFISFIIFTLSFCLFIGGSTAPVVNFGVYMSGAIVAAAIGNLIVFPALLGLFKIRFANTEHSK